MQIKKNRINYQSDKIFFEGERTKKGERKEKGERWEEQKEKEGGERLASCSRTLSEQIFRFLMTLFLFGCFKRLDLFFPTFGQGRSYYYYYFYFNCLCLHTLSCWDGPMRLLFVGSSFIWFSCRFWLLSASGAFWEICI